jgi:hypothetical protein
MSAVRTIIADLVDRRLWPVALALVAALVAVPVLLGGGSSEPVAVSSDPIANVAPAGTTAKAAISVSEPQTARQNRPGPVRNPFKQHHTKTADTVTNTTTAPAGSTSSDVTSSGGGGGGGGDFPGMSVTPLGGGSSPSGQGAKPAPVVKDIWRLNLRFGEAGDQHVRHDVPRLTPLPSATDPFFVFLGILSDGKTAVFLISSDATATGDGKCKPNPTQCDTIEMRAGDTEFFDVAQGNAGVVQYELDLLKIIHDKVSGKAAAARAGRHVSRAGHDVVHELKAEGDKSLGRYIYSYKRGVLVRRHGLDMQATTSPEAVVTPSATRSDGAAGTTWGG